MQKTQAATPYLCLDAARVASNLRRLADYAAGHGLGIRPHTKTHKLLSLSRDQLALGAVGLTVAKVGEAEVMAEASDDPDLLLAYPAVDEPRCRGAAALARDKTLRVAVDSGHAVLALAAAARAVGSTLGILVDLDVGMHRTGLQTPQLALELAQLVDRTDGVRLDGLFCYPGHIWLPADEQPAALRPIADRLQETLDIWCKSGLRAGIVSGGSTPTAYQSHHIPQLTEIRPGTYVFNDMNTVHGGYCKLDDCAARLVCTVVSDAVPGQVVLDAGSKTLTSDRCLPALDSGYGYVEQYPRAKITALSEEHGQVDVTACDRKPSVGEQVSIIPNHICPCVNLQTEIWWDRGNGQLTNMRVDARGRLS